MAVYKYGQAARATLPTATATAEQTAAPQQDNGGFLGGIGYVAEKAGLGFLSTFEGVWDYAAGGIASMFGNNEWAEQQFKNDWVDYSHPDTWYQPSDGLKTAGDVASGIGNSAASLVPYGIAAAVSFFSAGTLAPVAFSAASWASVGTAGLGAAGQSTKQAYQETGELGGKEYGYGFLSGATEAALEKVTGFLDVGGEAVVKSLSKAAAKKAAGEAAQVVAKKSIGKILVDGFVGEAFEEGMSAILEPEYAKITYNPNAQSATPQEIAYSAFVGGMSGMIMGGASQGISNATTRYQDTKRGKELVKQGKQDSILEMARQIAETERNTPTGDHAFEYTKEAYDKLMQSLATTDGKVTDASQQRMLGEVARWSSFSAFSPMISKSAANIYQNAEAFAERLNAYYSSVGGNMSVTAEEIRNGLDPKDPKTFKTALETNPTLRMLAIADATGHLFLDSTRFAQAAAEGRGIATQDDINRLLETADEAKINALSQRYGVDLRTATASEFNKAVTNYMQNGGYDTEMGEVRRSKAAKGADEKTAKTKLPKAIALKDGETVRYKIGDEDFSITREGDGYYLHDNKTDRATRKLTKAEVNKRLADYRQQAELSKPDTGDNEQKKTAETVDAWAGENVIGYNKLGNADKVGIRRLINSARAHGVSDADIAIYASISARSGVKITFENKPDADYNGYYSHKDNLITINIAKTKSAESTIIHEFDHAIRTVDGDFYIPVKEAADALTDAEFMQVMEAYSNETAMGKADELTAHGAEKLLAGQGVLTRLMDEQPKLLDRVLAFFKGAASDYKALPRLSKEAKRYYKKYKKMFDALSFRNAGGYVAPGDAVDFRYNRAAVDTHQKTLKQKYNEKSSPVPLNELLKGYERIVSMWDRIGSELNSEFLNRWNERKQDKAFTVFKAQEGYDYNIELSSMCKKGIPLFEAIDTIVRDEAMAKHGINRLGKAEKEVLYDVLKSHDFEIPCAICFVEQARQREGAVIDAFVKGNSESGKLGWNEVLDRIESRMRKTVHGFSFGKFDRSIAEDSYVPTDVILTEAEQKAFYSALAEEAMTAIKEENRVREEWNKDHPKKQKKVLPNVVTVEGIEKYLYASTQKSRTAAMKAMLGGALPANIKIFKVLLQDPNARRRIDADLLYSSVTTRNIAVYNRDFYDLFNAQGGTAGYKTKQSAIAYWGYLLAKNGKKWNSNATRRAGGIRNQSNSDFQVYQFLDYVQMYIDLTAKGFYLQAYTKSVAELKLFGKSRSKMNASLIPAVHRYYNADGTINDELTRENAGLDENGNPIYDDVEGINHTEAFALIRDPEYSKNVTGICIGYSDKHILKLLDVSEVQMIIGYHDKTNDPTKRYRGAVYATNYTGRNEAQTDSGETIHINFTEYIIAAEDLFKAAKQYDSKTDTYRGSIEHNGKTYEADDIPMLAADLYLEMCAEKGYSPAYSRGGEDFSKHPNYYKLLADYGLKDSKGHYAPHRKVAFSLPDTVPVLSADGTVSQMGTQEYLKAQLQSELEVRDRIARDLADTSEQGIIQQFVKGVKQLRQEQSYGVRKSKVLTDSQGNPITEAQADYFKDSLVRGKNGNLKVVYHGSGSQFTVFSHRFIGRHGSSEGQGFYFTDSENLASGYAKEGGQLLRGYLDIKKPLYDDKVTLTRAQIDKLIRKIDPTGDDLVANYDSQGGVGYPSRIWYERSVRDTVRAVMQYAESDSEILAELANSSGDAEKVLTEARRMFGYDGYIAHGHFGDATVYVAFTSEQFKNADNETPTSDPDIRKSKVLPSDTEYLDAVERGDMVTVRRMVREAATAAGYDSPMLYHGTDSFGFTEVRTTGVEKGHEWSPFFATSRKQTAGTYTNNANVREISEQMTEEHYERVMDDVNEEINDEIYNFRRLIDRTFSEWYFGQTDNSGLRDDFDNANAEQGYGDGIYDVFEGYIADAYYQHREDLSNAYEDYDEWIEESEEGQKLINSVLALEGLRRKLETLYSAGEGDLGGIYQLYSNTENLFVLEGNGANWNDLRSDKLPPLSRYGKDNVPYKTRDVAEWARANGYDGVLFKDIRDSGQYGDAGISDVYVFFNPQAQVKSADPVTYDDNGNIIPLSERFNPEKSDIRYSRPVESATIGAVMTSVDEGYKAGKMETLRDAAIATQIAITNAQAGIEAYGKKHGIKDIEARVQAVRSAQGQAGELIGGHQYRIGGATNEEKRVYLGQGLQEIMRPINDYGKGQKVSKKELKEMREAYKREFFDYLFNHLNVDRMTLESRSYEEKDANGVSQNDRIEAQKVAKADAKRISDELSEKRKKLGRKKDVIAEKQKLLAEIKELSAQLRKLREEIKERQAEIDTFEPRKNKPVLRKDNGSGGFTEVSADESREQIKKYDKERPEFKEIAEKLWAFLRNLNQYRVDTGLLSQDTADLLADLYAHYVPSYRADAKVGIAAIDGKRILGVRQTVKGAKGSLKDLLPIDVMIARQVEETVRAGRINQLANILYETAIDGETDEIQILSKDKVTTEEMAEFDPTSMRPKDGQITFYRDGEKIVMRVSKEIFAGFDAFTPQIDSKNPLANTLTAINNTFKKLVTSMNPAFLARNTIRDIQDAGINTKYPKTFVQNYARAAQEIMKDGELWRLYRAFGGYSSSIFDFDSGMQGHQNRFGFTQVEGNLLQRGITAIENANAFTEQLPRFAEFISAIEAGKSVEQAILDAADVTTNFGRSGRVVQVLNRTLVPFLNPAIQGFSKMIRNITSIRTAREFGALALKVTLIGLLPQAINMLMYGGDDDYEELKDTDKENNFLFKVGDKFVKLPRGRVAAALGGLVNRTASAVKGEDADWAGYVENVFQQVTPVDSMSRDIFSPFRDVQFNTTWYGSPIEGRQFDNTAPKDRYDESTSSIAKAISDGLHAIGFGFGISPKKVHYLLDQYSGVIGDFVLPATTAKPERDFLSGNFTIDPVASNELSTKFYKLYDEAVYARTDGDDTATYQVRYLTKVKNAISDMYDRKREIERSNLSDKEKQAETRVIQILINEAYRTALADYSLYTDAIKATSGIEDANIRFAEATRLVYGAERALKDYDGEVYKRASALKAAGVDYDTYYSYYFSTKDIEADKDIRGNDISGSKRKKVVSTITAMKIPKEQKMILINAAGYAVKDGDILGVKASTAKGILWRYIRNAKGLTEEQMEILARVCGFSVKNGKTVMNG